MKFNSLMHQSGTNLLRSSWIIPVQPRRDNSFPQPFYCHCTGQPVLKAPAVKNFVISLEQSFTSCMPLLMAAGGFRLGKNARVYNAVVIPAQSPYLIKETSWIIEVFFVHCMPFSCPVN